MITICIKAFKFQITVYRMNLRYVFDIEHVNEKCARILKKLPFDVQV